MKCWVNFGYIKHLLLRLKFIFIQIPKISGRLLRCCRFQVGKLQKLGPKLLRSFRERISNHNNVNIITQVANDIFPYKLELFCQLLGIHQTLLFSKKKVILFEYQSNSTVNTFISMFFVYSNNLIICWHGGSLDLIIAQLSDHDVERKKWIFAYLTRMFRLFNVEIADEAFSLTSGSMFVSIKRLVAKKQSI